MNLPSIKECPIVKITWGDATDVETGWLSLKEILEKKLISVESVGWLAHESEEKVILIGCWDEVDQNAGRAVIIPRPWIIKKEVLVCQA